MKLPEWVIPIKKLILTPKTSNWCQLPYYNHPKGCPEYGKKEICPPKAPKFEDYFDINASLFIIFNEFNLKNFASGMHEKHPDLSDKQCRCCLYWQKQVRESLRVKTILFEKIWLKDPCYSHTFCPEAMGLNVFATARLSGLKLDKTKNITTDRHIAIVGKLNISKIKTRRNKNGYE